MKYYKKLNHYFFGTESISLSDVLWFYGGYGFVITMSVLVFLSTL